MARGRFRSLSISAEVYEKLKRVAEKRGFSTLADTVAYLVTLEEEVFSRIEKLALCTSEAGAVSSAGAVEKAENRVYSSFWSKGFYRSL